MPFLVVFSTKCDRSRFAIRAYQADDDVVAFLHCCHLTSDGERCYRVNLILLSTPPYLSTSLYMLGRADGNVTRHKSHFVVKNSSTSQLDDERKVRRHKINYVDGCVSKRIAIISKTTTVYCDFECGVEESTNCWCCLETTTIYAKFSPLLCDSQR